MEKSLAIPMHQNERLISSIIRERIKKAGQQFFANDNISKFIDDNELELLQTEIASRVQALLHSLIIDVEHDHNTQDTAKRVAKMYINELYKGRYFPCPKITEFPNAKSLDEIFTLGPITINSTCSHHLVPIVGEVWVGILPGEKVIGISKYNRLIDWMMSRPHIQEEAAVLLADELEARVKPKGLAVIIKATHQCMTCRGVKEKNGASMINSVVRGIFSTDRGAKAEFFELIKSQGF